MRFEKINGEEEMNQVLDVEPLAATAGNHPVYLCADIYDAVVEVDDTGSSHCKCLADIQGYAWSEMTLPMLKRSKRKLLADIFSLQSQCLHKRHERPVGLGATVGTVAE